MIELHPYEEPHIVAAMLTYLYLLDYPDSEPDLVFGVPHHSAFWTEDVTQADSLRSSHITRQAKSDNGYEEHNHSDACSSEFALVPEEDENPELLRSNNLEPRPAHFRPRSLRTVSEIASPPSGSAGKDPSQRPSPLELHTQMYKAAVRFGIPCLAVQACDKFRKRIRGTLVSTAELLEAAEEAYADREGTLNNSANALSLGKMRQALVQALRGRWSAVKKQSEFENVVLQRPELGRDLMRLL